MTEFTLTFKVDTTSPQKAAALRDKCADWLNADDEVKVINQAMSQDAQTFTVFGAIKGKPDEAWREVILAANPEDARSKAQAKDKQRTVVAVLAGEVAPAA